MSWDTFLEAGTNQKEASWDAFLGDKATEDISDWDEFLGEPSPFKGGRPGGGAGGSFEKEPWYAGVARFISMGHLYPEYEGPEKEVIYDPETGEPALISPEDVGIPWYDDPFLIPAAAAIGGAGLPAKTVARRIGRGIREGVGWLTGGASEVPALTKAGVKGGARVIRGLEAKEAEKRLVSAAQKPFGEVPQLAMPRQAVAPTIPKAAARGIESEVKAKDFQERFIAEEGETFYSGIPIHKIGESAKFWTKYVGEPIWDKFLMRKVPKWVEKAPGGKSVNRALLYDYRGNLPDTAGYIRSLEDMKRYQAVGREYAIDLGQRLQKLPEPSQLKIGEFIKGEKVGLSASEQKLGEEAKRTLYDLGKQAVDVGLLSEEAFFKHAGRYMPRLYTSKEYQSLLKKWNLPKPMRLDLTRFKQRKDIPKEIREKMGEILTPGYPVAKGITQLTHDIEMARFFTGVSKNPQWALPKKTDLPIPEGWKQLSSNKRLGALSESHVHPEIYADLQETIRVMDTPEKVWRKALGSWKFGKVILSPKTHIRNLMSNSVLAHLGGMPMYEQPIYLARAAKEMRNKGKYWKAARQEGLLRETFTNAELRALFDGVEGQLGGIRATSIPERLGRIGSAWNRNKALLNKAAKLYEAEEQWFKVAKMIHNIERGKMPIAEAAKDAEKWLFNYSKITKFQEKYRSKWYGAPFATFTMKALPRMAEAAIKTPWRFALPLGMIYGLEKAAQKKIGDTKEMIEAKKSLRPEWQKGDILGIPNFARVPFVDDDGREYFLNLTYIAPWGDIGEGGGFGPIPGSLVPFTQPFIKEPISQIFNYDPFWSENIIKEQDVAGLPAVQKAIKEAQIRVEHLGRALLPTPFIDFEKAMAALRELPDYRGRTKPRGIVALDLLFGLKIYPVDYAEQAEREIMKLNPKNGLMAKKIKTRIKALSRKKLSTEERGGNAAEYDKQIGESILQLNGLAKETAEIAESLRTAGRR